MLRLKELSMEMDTIKYLNVSSYNPNQPTYHPLACNLQTCPLIYAYLMYDPTLAGNALFHSFSHCSSPSRSSSGSSRQPSSVYQQRSPATYGG
jgi:hypothetical protein